MNLINVAPEQSSNIYNLHWTKVQFIEISTYFAIIRDNYEITVF
jgi:hypothetical protein